MIISQTPLRISLSGGGTDLSNYYNPNEGFVVMPYMYPDLNVARDLVNAGAAAVMPLASPIGTNKGLSTKDFIRKTGKRIVMRTLNRF